jgi:hypothetical protein
MKKSFPWLLLIFGILFSTIMWPYFSFTYDQSNVIIGQYSEGKINPLNDTFRGLFFIFFPLSLYLITYCKLNKQNINYKLFKINNKEIKKKNINFLTLILIIFCLLEFLSLDYKNFLGALDSHHEGTFLSAQLNLKHKNIFWIGTFYDYGFLGNSIGVFFNYLFGDYTIGIQRFSFKFLIFLNKILLILICRKIINSINLTKNIEVLYLIFSLSTISLASLYDHVTPFHPRIFIYLIFTLIIFEIISSQKNNFLLSFIAGSFSIVSLLFYWDIGTYINLLLIFILIYFFLLKRHSNLKIIIFGIISSWLIFYLLIPNIEFKEFVSQYLVIINISDYLLGIEFPKPFSDKSTRHTKALLLIILSGVFLINFIFNNSKNDSNTSKFFLFFLFVSSIIFIKSGLMRSDAPHIKYTSGLYTLLIIFFISYHLIYFFNNLAFSDKIDQLFKKQIFSSIMTLIIGFVFFFQNNIENIFNIFNPNKNFYKLTKIDDVEFLNRDYLKFIKVYKNLTKNENCVQQFTDDNAIPYLVNKPTCTKYFVNGHIINKWTENNFIEELRASNPSYILYSSKINWFKSRNNAPNADKFIIDNYFLYEDLSPWIIYKKR